MEGSKAKFSVALILIVNVMLASSVSSTFTCARDALKFGGCANLLGDLASVVIGSTYRSESCCPLLGGLADLEAAKCLCTALRAKVLGVNLLDNNISLGLILNHCGKGIPSGFHCA